MIIGIGIDLVDLPSFRKLLHTFFDEFSIQCFGATEIVRILAAEDPILSMAVHFAIKEALLKTLGTGLKHGMAWEDIEVSWQRGQLPKVTLHSFCEEIAMSSGIQEFQIAVTFSRDGLVLASIIAQD